jgi:signal transduction histidine kinase
MEMVRQRAAEPITLDVLARSDIEAEMEEWLDETGVEDGWKLTAGLIGMGLDTAAMDDLAVEFFGEQLGALLCWLAAAFTNQSLMANISECAVRISDIVKAMKSYVYLDQAAVQNVDINMGLEDTLVVLGSRIPDGVKVRREFAPGLPRITAVGSDLNQVWTELIKNALDALDGKGEIVVRTRLDGRYVVVAVEDNGPGIAA